MRELAGRFAAPATSPLCPRSTARSGSSAKSCPPSPPQMSLWSLSQINRKVPLKVLLVPLLLLLLHLLLLLLNHAALSQSVEVLEVLLGRVHGAVVVIHARLEHGWDLVGEAAAEEALHELRDEAPAALQDVARQVLDLDENSLEDGLPVCS